jgi:excisionase family DNA binding protein
MFFRRFTSRHEIRTPVGCRRVATGGAERSAVEKAGPAMPEPELCAGVPPRAMLDWEDSMTRKEFQSLILERMDELERRYGDEVLDGDKITARERDIVHEVADMMARAGFPRHCAIGLNLRVGENSEVVKTYLSRCLKALRPKRRAGGQSASLDAEMLTPPQVARRYGVSPDTVRGWIVSGDLRAVSVGKGTRARSRVPADALEEFAAKRPARVAPKAPPQRRRRRKVDLPFRRYS